MDQRIISPGEGEIVHEKLCKDSLAVSAAVVTIPKSTWLAYPPPFMPIADFTVVFEELKKLLRRWSMNKTKPSNHVKKKVDESI